MPTNNWLSPIAPRRLSPPQYLSQPLILHPLALIRIHIRGLAAVLLATLRKELFLFLHLIQRIPQVYLCLIGRRLRYFFGTRRDHGRFILMTIGPVLVRFIAVLFTGGMVVHDVEKKALVELRVVY